MGLLHEPHALFAGHRRKWAVLHRSSPGAVTLEHRVYVELIFGHGPTLPSARHEHTRPPGQIRAHECIRPRVRAGLLDHDIGLVRRELAHERTVGA